MVAIATRIYLWEQVGRGAREAGRGVLVDEVYVLHTLLFLVFAADWVGPLAPYRALWIIAFAAGCFAVAYGFLRKRVE